MPGFVCLFVCFVFHFFLLFFDGSGGDDSEICSRLKVSCTILITTELFLVWVVSTFFFL